MDHGNGQSGIDDFDFLLKPSNIRDRRRANTPCRGREGVWEEFAAHHRGEKYLDGRVIIDHFAGTLPGGEVNRCMCG